MYSLSASLVPLWPGRGTNCSTQGLQQGTRSPVAHTSLPPAVQGSGGDGGGGGDGGAGSAGGSAGGAGGSGDGGGIGRHAERHTTTSE